MALDEEAELPFAALPPTLAKLVIVSFPPVRFPNASPVRATRLPQRWRRRGVEYANRHLMSRHTFKFLRGGGRPWQHR